jgi:hypothetical protein
MVHVVSGVNTGGAYTLPNLAPSGTSGASSYSTLQHLAPGTQLVSIQAAPSLSEAGLYDAYTGGGDASGGDLAGRGAAAAAVTTSGDMQRLVMAAPIASGGGGGGGTSAYQVAQKPQEQPQQQQQQPTPVSLSLPLSMQQLALVNTHLYNVQSMTGAHINVSPGATGLFHLLISGSKQSVEGARSLLSSILGQPIV